MTRNTNILCNLRSVDKHVKVGLPDGKIMLVKEVGDVKLNGEITLKNVLFIKDFRNNPLSVSRLLKENDFKMLFDKYGCSLQGHSIEGALKIGRNEIDLYKLEVGSKDGRDEGYMAA